ncbi:cytochrome P450 [Trametes elegans]|nr:cytochrome P450 [Trametes elegans]
MDNPYLLAGPLLIAAYAWYNGRSKVEDLYSRPREAYGEALATHGPVIGVWRKGNLEYVVNEQYARYVLTCDRLFSFERGTANIMYISPIMALTNWTLLRDANTLVTNSIVARLDEVVDQIWPLFQRDAKSFIDSASEGLKSGVHPSSLEKFHWTIAEVTIILFFGEEYISKANLQSILELSHCMAELTGQFQNLSFFGKFLPMLWIMFIWVKIMLIRIPFGFLRKFGPRLWRDVDRYQEMVASEEISPEEEPKHILYNMVKMYAPVDGGRIGLFRRVHMTTCLLCMIFAAVHTTNIVAQWVLFQLATRPEYLAPLREELSRVLEEDDTGSTRLTAASLREARRLDSFIREVMRLKGDTISSMRWTTCDVALGDVIIPRGNFVTAMSSTVHEDRAVFGDDAREFDGFRWAETYKEAVMTGPAHLVFGLGRWACPGRFLAIHEIKMIVFSLVGRATPTVLEGKFEVSDPLNTVTLPPKGTLVFTPLDKAYF